MLGEIRVSTVGGILLYRCEYERVKGIEQIIERLIEEQGRVGLVSLGVGGSGKASSDGGAGGGGLGAREVVGEYKVDYNVDKEKGIMVMAVYPKIVELGYISELLTRINKRVGKEISLATAGAGKRSGNQGSGIFQAQSRSSKMVGGGSSIRENMHQVLFELTSEERRKKVEGWIDQAIHEYEGIGQENNEEENEEIQKFGRKRQVMRRFEDVQKGKEKRNGEGKDKGKGKGKGKGKSKGVDKKEGRVWDNEIKSVVNEQDMSKYDFSKENGGKGNNDEEYGQGIQELMVNKSRDSEEEEDEDEEEEESDEEGGGEKGGIVGYLRGITRAIGLSKRKLEEKELEVISEKAYTQLVDKNVASEIAKQISEGLVREMRGREFGRMENIKQVVKEEMGKSLRKILTATKQREILWEIEKAQGEKRVYSIVFLGVNGVGKSTNLSKVGYWLLQNKYRVMVAACDTFRSGAVEQLKVHVRNLGGYFGRERITLFERGYGREAAEIAKEAIREAGEGGYDVVLIDTAGRKQDNEPLMKALGRLVQVNRPDLVVFVGEALVGNEAIGQLKQFNEYLERRIGGIILTKVDTIEDKIGAAINMMYLTNKPILFVGSGQTYGDMKRFRIERVIDLLLK